MTETLLEPAGYQELRLVQLPGLNTGFRNSTKPKKPQRKELAILWTAYYTLRCEQFYRLQQLCESTISVAAKHTKAIGQQCIPFWFLAALNYLPFTGVVA